MRTRHVVLAVIVGVLFGRYALEPPSRQPAQPAPIQQPAATSPAPAQPSISAAPMTPPAVVAPTQQPRVMFATSRVRVRRGPGTAHEAVTTLETGAQVTVLEADGEWLRIAAGMLTGGWINSRYLSEKPPVREAVQPPQPAFVAPPAIRKKAPSGGGSGGLVPIRDAYVGTCDCPYDRMRNGARCGNRSAYSKPGGREPECYK